STDATHNRTTSPPSLSAMSIGSTALPSDLCMALPVGSSVQPAVATVRNGAASCVHTPQSRELWNHPRCWSPPSMYISAGQGSSFVCPRTAAWLEPDPTPTSMISISLRNGVPLHWAHFVPGGRICSGVWSYHASAPFVANSSVTALFVASDFSPPPHPSQKNT